MFNLKATHKPVKAYYEALATFQKHGHTTEGNTRSAFADLLKRCASPFDWTLVEEYQFKGTNKQSLRADGALVDSLTLVHGLWEAKDSADDLPREIKAKAAKGYPLTNIIFQSPDRAILYQDNRIALDADLRDPEKLIEALELFFTHRQPYEVNWEEAVLKFSEKIPDLAVGVNTILEAEYKKNADFREKFLAFADLCRQSINPDLTDDAIRKMLVQHLLTERIFRKVFNNQEFLTRNVIAAEIEKVIHSITAKHFSRDTFLKPLDRFYTAIEKSAESQEGYTEKQHFLNAVYEKFFQSFDKKQADTHGIVYTPQPIVDFMVRSVEEVLKSEFGKTLSDEGVHVLDPFTGTGNFITRIIREIKRSRLPQKYANELHCNEIMLLPYYIASMNIEQEYLTRMSEYQAFEGICLVNTFELAEDRQIQLFTTENTARVNRQKIAPVTVVIANPPYNVGQENENDNNPNAKHDVIDRRVAETYRRRSSASSTTKLGNAYVNALRWASDRIGANGVVAFVTNNGFLRKRVFDGMRKCIVEDFTSCYFMDLGGDVRDNPKLSGTTHNVFGIMPGVCISILIKKSTYKTNGHTASYSRLDEYWRKGQKLSFLNSAGSVAGVTWEKILDPASGHWLPEGEKADYATFIPLTAGDELGIFRLHSMGVNTNRDAWTFNHNKENLVENVQKTLVTYNGERLRFHQEGLRNLTELVNDGHLIKWSSSLKIFLFIYVEGRFREEDIRLALYRPFVRQNLYFNSLLTHRRAKLRNLFPSRETDGTNICISVAGPDNRQTFGCLAASFIPSLDLAFEKAQCFSYYTYDYDKGGRRKENVTSWALDQYHAHYKSAAITKWDIFHSTYALLHHPRVPHPLRRQPQARTTPHPLPARH